MNAVLRKVSFPVALGRRLMFDPLARELTWAERAELAGRIAKWTGAPWSGNPFDETHQLTRFTAWSFGWDNGPRPLSQAQLAVVGAYARASEAGDGGFAAPEAVGLEVMRDAALHARRLAAVGVLEECAMRRLDARWLSA